MCKEFEWEEDYWGRGSSKCKDVVGKPGVAGVSAGWGGTGRR